AASAPPSARVGLKRYLATMTLYAVRRSWAACSEGGGSSCPAAATGFLGGGGDGSAREAARSLASHAARNTARPARAMLSASSFLDTLAYPFGDPAAAPPVVGLGEAGNR